MEQNPDSSSSASSVCRSIFEDVITLHCPLTEETRHLIDAAAIAKMRPGVINTSRGALIDTPTPTRALESGEIGHLGPRRLRGGGCVFEDQSDPIIQDDVFSRLLTF